MFLAFSLAFFFSSITYLLLARLGSRFPLLTSYQGGEVQRAHDGSVPRVGGLVLLAGLWLCGFLEKMAGPSLLLDIVVCLVPAFLIGVYEDFSGATPPLSRLCGTLATGFLCPIIVGVSVKTVDFVPIDVILAYPWISVGFTAFAVGGLANAFNMIDGANGLASGLAFSILVVFLLISYFVGDLVLCSLILCCGGLILAFMIFNYPLGKIFLGDGGAYTAGGLVGIIAVLLIDRNPGLISPWAILLAVSYPVVEVLYSMLRRSVGRRGLMDPDIMHLHSLIMGYLSSRLLADKKRRSNLLVFPILLLFCLPFYLVIVMFYHSTSSSMVGFGMFVLGYALVYRFLRRTIQQSVL